MTDGEKCGREGGGSYGNKKTGAKTVFIFSVPGEMIPLPIHS